MRNRIALTVLAGLLVAGLGVILDAQRQRASPHEKTQAKIDGASISIEYGRPYVKGRKIYGGLVPFGQVWRTGADEATTIVTDKTLVFGSLTVPAGTYTLYTLPNEKEWMLIVSKKTGQWGASYPEGEDLGRVPMKVSATTGPVEQLTITIADTAAGGELQIDWESTRATAAFVVK
jgi:hypothetical protein